MQSEVQVLLNIIWGEKKTLLLCFLFLNHNKNNQKKIDNVIVSKFDKLTWGDYRSKHTTCFVS